MGSHTETLVPIPKPKFSGIPNSIPIPNQFIGNPNFQESRNIFGISGQIGNTEYTCYYSGCSTLESDPKAQKSLEVSERKKRAKTSSQCITRLEHRCFKRNCKNRDRRNKRKAKNTGSSKETANNNNTS